MENLNINNLAIFALVSSVIAGWNQIKTLIGTIFSIFVRTDTLQHSLCSVITDVLLLDIKIFRWGNENYINTSYSSKEHKIAMPCLFKTETRLFCLYKKYIPIIISGKNSSISITYLFKTFDFTDFLIKCQQVQNDIALGQKISTSYFKVDHVSGEDSFANSRPNVNSDYKINSSSSSSFKINEPTPVECIIDNLHVLKHKGIIIGQTYENFKNDLRDFSTEIFKNYYWSNEGNILLDEINFWLNSKIWFNNKQIAWRRGCLLSGRPGSGKTKLVLECAKFHKLHVTVINISNMSNSEFIAAYKPNSYVKYGIILIEDIDAVFEFRKNILNKDGGHKQLLTFDTLINAIGGLQTSDGIFTIITTNRPEVLDDALTRKGRMDLHLTIDNMCEDGRRFIANNLLSDWPEIMEEKINICSDCTAAEFENLCIETAIEQYNKNRTPIIDI